MGPQHTCMQCGRRQREPLHRTPTRELCDGCFTTWQGASAGVLAGGGVPGAISTAGWLHALRSRLRR